MKCPLCGGLVVYRGLYDLACAGKECVNEDVKVREQRLKIEELRKAGAGFAYPYGFPYAG